MSYHNYKLQGPYTCYDQIHHFRKNFIPDLGCNGSELRAATDSALEMRLENPGLPEVPLAQNAEWPSLQDFVRLEQWFISVYRPITDVTEEAWATLEEKDGQSNCGKADSPNEKSSETWYWKLYEKTIKAVIAAILDKINPS